MVEKSGVYDFVENGARFERRNDIEDTAVPFPYRTGKMPVPQRLNFLVEQAGKPVLKNGAISQFNRI